jgi:hypothetical protein
MIPLACTGDGVGDDAGASSSSTSSLEATSCVRESANAAQLVAVVGRAGTAYTGELLAPEGEFESASSPLSDTVIKRRDDAISMLRRLAASDSALAADGGIQSSSGVPAEVDGHRVVEVSSKYGVNGRVLTFVDCSSGLVRRISWQSFG